MSQQLNEQFFALVNSDPQVAKLKKFWSVQQSFSTKSPHMLFIIKYYVVKKIYQLNQQRPDHNKKAFMRSLAMDLSQLKKEIQGNNHDEKIERIRQ